MSSNGHRPSAVVDALYFRSNKALSPKEAAEVAFIGGRGVDGDCHSSPLTPRQVLIALSDSYADLQLPANTLRENILLRPDDESSGIQLESGDTLSLEGATLKLRITFACEPCGRLNRTRPNLSRDIRGRRGWLARVVESGVLRAGDRLRLDKNVYPAFSDDWHERVIAVARLLPADRSLSYSTLALLAGVASGYCRAFPRLLRTHNLPTERIIPSSISPAPLPEWNGEGVFVPEQLWQE